MKLTALTTAMRESRELSNTVLTIGVVKPLMFNVPETVPVPNMEAPVMTVGFTVAKTPVMSDFKLMAAALAMALAMELPDFCGDNWSSMAREAPMGTPLMITSLENMVSSLVKERATSNDTLSPLTKAAAAGVEVTCVIFKSPPDNMFLPARSSVVLSMVTTPAEMDTPAAMSKI